MKMTQAAILWKFEPEYLPNAEVWWAAHVLKKGIIRGISYSYFKNKDTFVHTVFYSVEETSGEIVRMYEIHKDLLFKTREELLVHLENT